MLRFNLLPDESIRYSKSYQQFILLARSSFLTGFWLIIITLIVFLSNLILTREIILIRENSDRLVTYNSYVAKSGLGQSVKRLEEEVTVLSEVRKHDYSWLTVLLKAFQNVPNGIRVQSVRGSDETATLTVQGTASSRAALLDWQTSLQSMENVIMVDLPITDLLNKDNISFTLTLTLTNL